jgi:hypothetical protein
LGLALLLPYPNLRGMRESITVVLPIFLGFFITHVPFSTAFSCSMMSSGRWPGSRQPSPHSRSSRRRFLFISLS